MNPYTQAILLGRMQVRPTRLIRRALAALALCGFAVPGAHAQNGSVAERIANAVLQQHSHTLWDQETGTRLQGMDAEWYNTANGDYFRYVQGTVDAYLDAPRPAAVANPPDSALADALLGRQLLRLYRVTLAAKYYHAATELRIQLAAGCGLSSAAPLSSGPAGAAPAKLCVAEPFLAEYASVFHAPQDFDAITRDFLQWADATHKPAGNADSAPYADAKSEAQLAAALVDSLPFYPPDHPGQARLIAVLNRIAAAITKVQGANGALVTSPADGGNHTQLIAAPAQNLYIYALLKGVRLGYLPAHESTTAERAWAKLQKDPDHVDLSGATLLAATEVDLVPTASRARGQTILVDAWFNSQQRKNAAGQMEYFHYKWSDFSDSGYSLLGHMFRAWGMSTDMLEAAPTRENLSKAQFYLIVSPDIPVKNPTPHYMTEEDGAKIASWVHDGGVLILMENDPPNADISHLNLLSDRFGIHFNDVLSHHILGEHVEDGTIPVHPDGHLFHEPHTLYMKDTCSISLHGAATVLLSDRGDVVMATAKYGRGTVFAAVDPWVYNEYTDGRKNSRIYGQFDNFAAGRELVRWLIEQRPAADSMTR